MYDTAKVSTIYTPDIFESANTGEAKRVAPSCYISQHFAIIAQHLAASSWIVVHAAASLTRRSAHLPYIAISRYKSRSILPHFATPCWLITQHFATPEDREADGEMSVEELLIRNRKVGK